MGFEPNAENRLQLLWATTRDERLRLELSTAIRAGEDHGMSFVPSADLLRQINSCPACELRDPENGREGLCEVHRVRWNVELCTPASFGEEAEETLDRIMRSVLASESGARQLLTALDRQLRALNMVWEAHERGAIRLPDRIAESVRQARLNIPSFLSGSPVSAIKQAS